MSPALDNGTVFTVSAYLFLTMTVITWLMLGRPRRGPTMVWSLGGLLVGGSVWLISQRGYLGPLWSFELAQTLYLASFLVLAQSLRMDLQRPWPWGWLVVVVLAYGAVITWGFADKRSQNLAIVVRVVNSVGLWTLTATAFQLARQERSRNAWFMTAGYALMASGMLLATVGTVRGQASLQALGASIFAHILGWVSILTLMLSYLGYLGLVLERSLRENVELRQAQWQAQQWRERGQALALQDRQHTLDVLANSLGHAIVQPLTATLLQVQMVRRLLQSGALDVTTVAPMLEQVMEGIRRSSDQVERIRKFLRPQAPHQQTVLLQAVVQDAHSLLSQEMMYQRVDFQVSVPESALLVTAQALPLTQALVQVLRNAMHAVQARPHKAIGLSLRQAGSEAWLEVNDSGPGFPLPMLTRSHGGDLPVVDQLGGLGLYMTQAVLAECGGRLELSNPKAGGAQVRMVLPLA